VPDKVGAFSPSNTFPSGDFDDSAAGAAAEPTAPNSPEFDPSLVWSAQKSGIEVVCALLPCQQALGLAKVKMPDDGLAEAMVDHFRLGESTPMAVNLNVELARNPQLKEFVAGRIEHELAELHQAGSPLTDASGAVWVPQSAYGPTPAGKDQQMSLGGTFFEYRAVATADTGDLEVELNVSDHYFWSPSDSTRTTQCLHECATEMVFEGGATEFYQHGEGSLLVNDPRAGAPMSRIDPGPREER
jgi:hypothetical protein